jgi:hypothetical protein
VSRPDPVLAAFEALRDANPPSDLVDGVRASVRTMPQRRGIGGVWLTGLSAAAAVVLVATAIAVTADRPTPVSASPSAVASASGEPTISPPAGLLPGSIARATVDFSLSPPQEVVAGQTVLIVAGPVDHDGSPSYLIQHYGDLTAGYRPDGNIGWVTADIAAERLRLSPPSCPVEPVTLDTAARLQPFARVVCFGDRELTFGPVTASDYQVGVRTSSRWISSDGNPDFFTALPLYTGDGVPPIADGAWIEVTGRFDDPGSADCGGGDAGLLAWCRERFIVTAVTAVATPQFVLRGAWRPTALPDTEGRSSHAMVWTGSEVIVWGGVASSRNGHSVFDASAPRDGLAYDPATDSWRDIGDAPIVGRESPITVWSGTEVIVFGGRAGEDAVLDGAAYDPVSGRWRKLADAPMDGLEPVGGWVDGRLVVVTSTGAAAYDSGTDRWTPLPAAPGRVGWRTAAVAGDRLFVVSFGDGATPPVDWAVLDPIAGTWASGTVPIDPLMAGTDFVGAGDRVVALDAGLSFDPRTREWTTGASCTGLGGGAAWTGRWVVGVAKAWDSSTGRCLDLPPSPPREPPFDGSNGREFPAAVWTGREYVTWAGGNGGDIVWIPRDGAVFRPEEDLSP